MTRTFLQALLVIAAAGAGAQEPAFPNRPMRIVSPLMVERWDRPVVTDNRPSAVQNAACVHQPAGEGSQADS